MDADSVVIKMGMIARGPKVEEFETAFAEHTGYEYAAAVKSGTAALHAALLLHGIGRR
ncbi:MAG: DegT/DnrJ/EryC1/StrS family aminotransferase [Methanosarcinaceae archaeon]|nr:DegT/DnrJ/EryC1/StrS family aminotransferase [Methanosarcinaceae archaeon]